MNDLTNIFPDRLEVRDGLIGPDDESHWLEREPFTDLFMRDNAPGSSISLAALNLREEI